MVWAAGLEPIAVPDESNLVCKAARELAQAIGRTEDESVRIVVEKSVPAQTGLGGGSSDAAAVLVAMANLWGLQPDDGRLEQVARSLGADVAFFLHGGCALLDGAGDTFVHALDPSKKAVAIVKPEGGVSTAAAYATFDDDPGEVPASMLAEVNDARNAEEIPLFNNLAPASEKLYDVLAEVREFAGGFSGVEGVLLCGSGSGTFAVCDSYEAAQSVSSAALARGWWARATSFTSLGAAILPG